MSKNKKTQRGFTILVAVVTAGILLIIAMSIGGIALKEQVLSTANKESQIAFYAADTGMECALYWDQKKGIFAPVVVGNSVFSPAEGTKVDINCNGEAIETDEVSVSSRTSPSKYSYFFKVPNLSLGESGSTKTCAVVKITKTTGDSSLGDANKTYTDIYSYGYNTCDASINRLERGVEGHY